MKEHNDNRSTFCVTMYPNRGEIELSDIITSKFYIFRTIADGNEEE